MSAANNFMLLEPQIVALARAAVEGNTPAVHVLTSADLAGLKEQLQYTPAVHVIYQGFRVAQTRSDGRVAVLRHTWLVVAVVGTAHSIVSGATARADGGALLAQVCAALMGRKLDGAVRLLLPTDSPRAWSSPGFHYTPMAFAVDTHFSAT